MRRADKTLCFSATFWLHLFQNAGKGYYTDEPMRKSADIRITDTKDRYFTDFYSDILCHFKKNN